MKIKWMTGKLAMVLCVAGALTLTSCEKDDFTDAVDDTIENAYGEDGVDFGDNRDENSDDESGDDFGDDDFRDEDWDDCDDCDDSDWDDENRYDEDYTDEERDEDEGEDFDWEEELDDLFGDGDDEDEDESDEDEDTCEECDEDLRQFKGIQTDGQG